jgi:hypothetical protein
MMDRQEKNDAVSRYIIPEIETVMERALAI